MKKLSLLITLLFLIPQFASAQLLTEQRTTTFGIKGGWSMSTFKGDGISFIERSGNMIGAHFRVPMGQYFAIQPEIAYQNMGAKQQFDHPERRETLENIYHLDYIQAPLLLVFSLPIDGVLVPDLHGGPYGALLSSAVFDEIEELQEARELDNPEERLNETDYGLVLGATLATRLTGMTQAFLELRLQIGMAEHNLFDDPEFEDLWISNEVQSLTLGIRF